ncbi:MAG: methyltransferase family protein [Marinosulfonomonas sp.]
MIRGLDLPPIWLIGFIALAWWISTVMPGVSLSFPWQGAVAMALFLIGILLTGLAAFEMARARTTIIPHRTPDALVTSGVFRWTRNPIYLGDVLILTSFVLWFQVAAGLFLVPVFMWVIRRRFIDQEEQGLRAKFAGDFEDWQKKTRRWM